MVPDNPPVELLPFEYGIVRKKAQQIIGRAGFKAQDQKDLEQELLARLLKRLKSYDPERGHPKTFATVVVERDVANILREARAGKRDPRRVRSLDTTMIGTGERTDVARDVSDTESDRRCGRHSRNAADLAQLGIDLTEVIAKLPPCLREVCQRLQFKSIAQIARDLGIPRTTLNDIVRRIRSRFEQAGLRNYL